MADLVYKVNLHYSSSANLPDNRQRVEEALAIACRDLEKHSDTQYISYKITEEMDLES